jgi:hypothetical protein
VLYESPPYYLINGVSILPDHADPLQFYYMPMSPRFVTQRSGAIEVPQLLLIKYASEVRTGGFADFDVHLALTEDELRTVRTRLQQLAGLDQEPRIAPVPLVDGSVKLMLFGRETGDQQLGDPAPADAAPFVRSIHHSAKPALYGENRAAFSVELDEHGITILEQAMHGNMAPIGVVYALDYLALRPAYHVKLTINWDRTQQFLDTTYGQEGLFTSIQIQNTVDKLVEEQVIKFEVDNFTPEDEGGTVAERMDAAVARARDMITDAFFESSLDPLRDPPDGWDKAADTIKSFSPQRFTPMGVFSYKHTDVTRIDQKRLDVDFSERTTIKRTIYPQGHLSGLFRALGDGLDLSQLVIEVNADDPFFQRRRVRVISRSDFTSDPVRSLTATLTYGGAIKTVRLDKDKTDDVVSWPSTVVADKVFEPVATRFEASLQPAEAGERPNKLQSGSEDVLGETAELQPRELFDLEDIAVLTRAGFPFDRYPQVDVNLTYEDPANGIRQNDVVHLDKDAPSSLWQRFLVGAPAGPVLAKVTYYGSDNRNHSGGFAPLTAPIVDVGDPFAHRLRVNIVSALDFNQVERAFVDLAYRDPPNGIEIEDSIEITKDSPARPFIVDRVDPNVDRVRYKIAILMLDSTLFEGPWSTTLGTRIFVRLDLRGHRAVTIRGPLDFTLRKLERMTVEARARDEVAGLSFDDRLEFVGDGSTGTFEFDFVDPAKDAFELRVTRLFKNGMSAVVDWTRFDLDEVAIPATT